MANNPYEIDMPDLLKLQRMEDRAMHLIAEPSLSSGRQDRYAGTRLESGHLEMSAASQPSLERQGPASESDHSKGELHAKQHKGVAVEDCEGIRKASVERQDCCCVQLARGSTVLPRSMQDDTVIQHHNQPTQAGRCMVVFNKNDWSTHIHLRGGAPELEEDAPSACSEHGSKTPSRDDSELSEILFSESANGAQYSQPCYFHDTAPRRSLQTLDSDAGTKLNNSRLPCKICRSTKTELKHMVDGVTCKSCGGRRSLSAVSAQSDETYTCASQTEQRTCERHGQDPVAQEDLHFRGGPDSDPLPEKLTVFQGLPKIIEGLIALRCPESDSPGTDRPTEGLRHVRTTKNSNRICPPSARHGSFEPRTLHVPPGVTLLNPEEMISALQVCFESHPFWTHHELADVLEQPPPCIFATLHQIALYGPWKGNAFDQYCWQLPPADHDELAGRLITCFVSKPYWATHDLSSIFQLPEEVIAEVLAEIAIFGPWLGGSPQKWCWRLKPGRKVSGVRWKGKGRAMADLLPMDM